MEVNTSSIVIFRVIVNVINLGKNFNFINTYQNNLFKILNRNGSINHYNNFKTKSCGKCCNCIYASNGYYLKASKYNLPLLCNDNCKAKNCIYILKCFKCDCIYIGQTNNFYKRLNNHLSTIKNYDKIMNNFNNNRCIEVAKHFNESFHNFHNDFKFFIFKNNIESRENREYIENDLINICKKLNINVLNDYIPMHFKYKKLSFI